MVTIKMSKRSLNSALTFLLQAPISEQLTIII